MTQRGHRVPASLIALAAATGIAFAACSSPGTTSAPTEAMMEHSPSPSDAMMAHSAAPTDAMMEHSATPTGAMMEHSPSPT